MGTKKELLDVAEQSLALNKEQQDQIKQLYADNDQLIAQNKQLVAEVERLKADYLVVNFGHGSIEVAEGVSENAYAMMFGNNGGGIVGQPLRGERYMKKQETLAVLKFHSLASIDVVLARLNCLRQRIANHDSVEIKNDLGEVIEVITPKLQGASK